MNAIWVKSSFSFSNGNCVEVAELPGGSVGVRNSREPAGPVLRFTRDEWDAFLRRAGDPPDGLVDRQPGDSCREEGADLDLVSQSQRDATAGHAGRTMAATCRSRRTPRS